MLATFHSSSTRCLRTPASARLTYSGFPAPGTSRAPVRDRVSIHRLRVDPTARLALRDRRVDVMASSRHDDLARRLAERMHQARRRAARWVRPPEPDQGHRKMFAQRVPRAGQHQPSRRQPRFGPTRSAKDHRWVARQHRPTADPSEQSVEHRGQACAVISSPTRSTARRADARLSSARDQDHLGRRDDRGDQPARRPTPTRTV